MSGRDFGKHWERFPDEWLEILQEGDARRFQERFAKEAADAQRKRLLHGDKRSDAARWAEEFAQAMEQREQRRLQAIGWAQERRIQRAATA